MCTIDLPPSLSSILLGYFYDTCFVCCMGARTTPIHCSIHTHTHSQQHRRRRRAGTWNRLDRHIARACTAPVQKQALDFEFFLLFFVSQKEKICPQNIGPPLFVGPVHLVGLSLSLLLLLTRRDFKLTHPVIDSVLALWLYRRELAIPVTCWLMYKRPLFRSATHALLDNINCPPHHLSIRAPR